NPKSRSPRPPNVPSTTCPEWTGGERPSRSRPRCRSTDRQRPASSRLEEPPPWLRAAFPRNADRLGVLGQSLPEHDGVHVRVVELDRAVNDGGRGLERSNRTTAEEQFRIRFEPFLLRLTPRLKRELCRAFDLGHHGNGKGTY